MSRPTAQLLQRPPHAPAQPAPALTPRSGPFPPTAPHLRPGSGRGRATAMAAITLLVALTCTSCVLVESKDYLVQPAPPDGIHVTIRHSPTQLLALVSDLVTAGVAIDRALADRGLRLTCDAYPNARAFGDRCAFRVLGASKRSGSLVSRALAALAWQRALRTSELGDFSHDALGQVRLHRNACVHVTIRGGTRQPDANWTWRGAGSKGC